jgi:hypothetical protein
MAHRRTVSVLSEEEAMVALDQPEILEPEFEETGANAPEDGAAAPDGESDNDPDGGSQSSGSSFVPIAVGLAALLPLPSLSNRRC